MKKLILALFLLSASVTMIGICSETVYAKSGGGNSNEIPASEVPAPVKKSFKADYPNAKSVEWEYTPVYYGTPVYTASFKQGHDKWVSSYYPDGTRVSAYPKP